MNGIAPDRSEAALRICLPSGTTGEIHLPAGRYFIDEPLRIANVRVTIRGEVISRPAPTAWNIDPGT